MTTIRKLRRKSIAIRALGALFAGLSMLGPSNAHAGSCPADKVSSNARQPGPDKHKNVSDKVIASIDLADEAPKLKDHKFRLRRLIVQPGGIVAWHSHAERPAIIYIVSGSIVEYASTCAAPIIHKAGDVARETHATSHWWKNVSGRSVVLLSTDILHDKADPHTM